MSISRAQAKNPKIDINSLYVIEAVKWITFFQQKMKFHPETLRNFEQIVTWSRQMSPGQGRTHRSLKETFIQSARDFLGKHTSLTTAALKAEINQKGAELYLIQPELPRRHSAPITIMPGETKTDSCVRTKYYKTLGVFKQQKTSADCAKDSPTSTYSKSY